MVRTAAERKQLSHSIHAERLKTRKEERENPSQAVSKQPREFSRQDVDNHAITFFTGLERVLEEGDPVLIVSDPFTTAEIARGYTAHVLTTEAQEETARTHYYAHGQNQRSISPNAGIIAHHPATQVRELVRAAYLHISLDDPHALDYLTIASETVTGPINIHLTTNPGLKKVQEHPRALVFEEQVQRLFDLEVRAPYSMVAGTNAKTRPIILYTGEHEAREAIIVPVRKKVIRPNNSLREFLAATIIPSLHSQPPRSLPISTKRPSLYIGHRAA